MANLRALLIAELKRNTNHRSSLKYARCSGCTIDGGWRYEFVHWSHIPPTIPVQLKETIRFNVMDFKWTY